MSAPVGRPDADLRYPASLPAAASPDVVQQLMNPPPSSSIRIDPLDNTNNGASPRGPRAAFSVPVALLTRFSDRAGPAQPPIRPSTARSLPPRHGRMFARTTGSKPASAAVTLQSP